MNVHAAVQPDTVLDLALHYNRLGIPIFPCRSADEDAFDPSTGEVTTKTEKSPLTHDGLKGATKNERIVRIWFGERHRNALIGVPTGEKLGAWVFDVDVKRLPDGTVVNGFETLEALEDIHGALPATAMVSTANGGRHYYFKHVEGVRNRGGLGAALDCRGDGGYVIGPGSVMADGRSYAWLDHDGDGLPEFADAPGWLLDMVLPKPFESSSAEWSGRLVATGENPAWVTAAVNDELETLARKQAPGRGELVNRTAFKLGQFIAAGALDRGQAEADILSAASANGVLAKDGDKEIRAKIRRGIEAGLRLPRQVPERSANDNWQLAPGVVANLVANHNAKRQGSAEEEFEESIQTSDNLPATTDELPDYQLDAVADLESLTCPGGLVQDLVDWIVSSAEQPSRTLALAASLPLVAALMGPRYSTGSRDTRPNIYSVALAESGFGKEHARSQIKRLLAAGHGVFDSFGGPARIMSASALREVLEAHQSVNCQIDEFGGFIREITDRRAGGHQRAISVDLRDYFSASATFFEGAAYRGSPPKRIHNPNLCIHGTSTPEQFWSALSSASAEDGLLPRLILFNVDTAPPAAVKPAQDVRYVPSALLDKMADVAGIDVVKKRTGNLAGIKLPSAATNTPTSPHVVPWTDGAVALFDSVKEAVSEHEKLVVPEARPFVRRIIENAIKLALIVAVGIDHAEPMITEANVDWASSLAWTCAAGMLSQVTERLSDNPREANYKRIAAMIRAAGSKGITAGRLADRLKSIDARQRDEIIKDLKEADLVHEECASTGGRPKRRLVFSTR
ncbi:bifunctional DNA primase/polymerase [Mesorhizobium sp. VK22B]|uniref:Bifunctional DNA primase/polymerase n=1 Tax=Mesorhizobium captivum TaxID=3072319 RepID=A0ABU4Z9B9_9HYPH|nr:bifunctional DNA primase/polymerase [Mesorhizobium sp. VK22B]MDX8495865.1 bifunctional DNA primase/polymerase [Mesorhizobium sp. VK22B]